MTYTSPYRDQANHDSSRAAEYLRQAELDEQREQERRAVLKLQLQDAADVKKEDIDKEVEKRTQDAQAWGEREKQIIQDQVEVQKQQIDQMDTAVRLA